MTISIITPWLNAAELCPMYERGVKGAQVIIVDNGSERVHAAEIHKMVHRIGGDSVYWKQQSNLRFAKANNLGLLEATGDIVIFMNNDVECRPGWLDQVRKDVKPGALYAPSKLNRYGVDYLEGWCIAAKADVWRDLGGWPEHLPGMYYEDNFLCLEAQKRGYKLEKVNWPVWHFNNYTSRQTQGAYDHSAANARAFQEAAAEYVRG